MQSTEPHHIPFHLHYDNDISSIHNPHQTGIRYRMNGFIFDNGVLDTGAQTVAISYKTSKKIGFDSLPLIRTNGKNLPPTATVIKLEPKTNFHIETIALKMPEIYGDTTIIPPDLFYNLFDVEFSAEGANLLEKYFDRVSLLPYVKVPDKIQPSTTFPSSIGDVEKKWPFIRCRIGGAETIGLFDSGAINNHITKAVADIIDIERYPSAGTIYTDQFKFQKGYYVPVEIGEFTVIMPTYVLEWGTIGFNMMSADYLLRVGYRLTYTSNGIRVGVA